MAGLVASHQLASVAVAAVEAADIQNVASIRGFGIVVVVFGVGIILWRHWRGE